VHTGRPHVGSEGYVGEDVHPAARIAGAGHGGQVLVSQATRALVDGELADLGEHRVKDFLEPVWIFQLGQERFPPLKTISNTNLPRPASSFVGREREMSAVVELLQDGARLVTLSGPGRFGAGLEQRSELGRRLHHLLEVVQQQEQLALPDVLGQAVLRPQRLGDGIRDEGRVAQSSEPDPGVLQSPLTDSNRRPPPYHSIVPRNY
jgi:hypothetical protein